MTQDNNKTINLTQEQLEALIQNAIKDAKQKEHIPFRSQPQAPPYPLDAPFELVNCGLKTVVGTALGVVELVGQGAFALIDTITLNKRR